MRRAPILLLLAASALPAQQESLARLKREAARMKVQPYDSHEKLAAVHAALRDWIESRLPADKGAFDVEFPSLQYTLPKELTEAFPEPAPGAIAGDDSEDLASLGRVGAAFTTLRELPDTLFVTGQVHGPCGEEEAVYVYHFDAAGRQRWIENHPDGYRFDEPRLSGPDAQGRRLLLLHAESVQCASFWRATVYSVYRLNALAAPPERLLSGKAGFYMGNDPEGLTYLLKPDELILERADFSVDAGVLVRPRIHRYSFTDGVRRLDPIAIQPQDFVAEWLTSPWSEMQSRSAPETAAGHARWHADSVWGDYTVVVQCAGQPGEWLVGIEITNQGHQPLKSPLPSYFLVRDLGEYRYRMESVSTTRPEGCPGQAGPSFQSPWLSEAQLKALH